MMRSMNVSRRSFNAFTTIRSGLKFPQISTIGISTNNVLFQKLLENSHSQIVTTDSRNYNHVNPTVKSSSNDVDSEHGSTMKINAWETSHTTLLMDLMDEMAHNFARRSFRQPTCDSWHLETFIDTCQMIDWDVQLNDHNNCIKTLCRCCKAMGALHKISTVSKLLTYNQRLKNYPSDCENSLTVLFDTLTQHNLILENQCIQLYYFEQLSIFLAKGKMRKLLETKHEEIDELIDKYYNNGKIQNADEKQAYETAIKTKILLINFDLYLNCKNFTKLPTWQKKFEYKYKHQKYIKPNLLTYCIIFDNATEIGRRLYSDTNAQEKKFYMRKLIEAWYDEFVDISTTLSESVGNFEDKLISDNYGFIYPIFKAQTLCNVDLEIAQLLFDKLYEMNMLTKQSFSYVFECILRGNCDDSVGDVNPFFKDLLKYVDMYVNDVDRTVDDRSNRESLLKICFKYNDSRLCSLLTAHIEFKRNESQQSLFKSILDIIHKQEKQNEKLKVGGFGKIAVMDNYYSIHDQMWQLLINKCVNCNENANDDINSSNNLKLVQLYHGYLSAVDRIVAQEKAKCSDRDVHVVCTNFYSWLRGRLLTMFEQRVNQIIAQSQSNPNLTKLDEENNDADIGYDECDYSDSDEIEVFVSNIIYLMLNVEYILLKDELIKTNGLRDDKSESPSLDNKDISQIIMENLINNEQNWYKVYMECNKNKMLQSMFGQQWTLEMAHKIMVWLIEHDTKLMDHDYYKSFMNEMGKYGVDSGSFCKAKQLYENSFYSSVLRFRNF